VTRSGSLFGVGLGPCPLAFMAPVLGVVFTRAEHNLAGAVCLLGSFALGHCGVIVLAGTLTQQVENYPKWTQTSQTMKWVRRTCGLLVLLAGVELLLSWQPQEKPEMMIGMGHFFPAEFVRRTGPAKSAAEYFLQVSYGF
jgi:hypothetical protein